MMNDRPAFLVNLLIRIPNAPCFAASQIMFAEHYVNIRVMLVEYSCKCSPNISS